MVKDYLIDSNVIIDFCNGKLPQSAKSFLFGITPKISIITQIELFANPNIPRIELDILEEFVNFAEVFEVNSQIVPLTILLRQKYKVKLPDAIIASTAIENNLILLTRNTDDFKKILELEAVNPWNIEEE